VIVTSQGVQQIKSRPFNQQFSITITMANSNIPQAMKALVQPDKFSTDLILSTAPVPTANGPTEHLLRIHSTAITNGELLWPRYFSLPAPLPQLIPTYDVTGTLVSAPADSPFKVGDEVYTRTNYNRPGCAAEYTVVLTEELAMKPKSLSWQQAATVPMSAMTAWQALFEHAGLEPKSGEGAKGKKIFVTAASGAVGASVVQLAKWAGAEVAGTCSTENLEYVQSLGAAEAIDYKTTNLKEWVAADEARRADIVIDCIGQKSLADAWWVVKDGGVLISVHQPPEEMKPEGLPKNVKNVKNEFFIMYPDGKQLRAVSDLIDAGKFKPSLDSSFPFEKFEEAFKRAGSGKARGKVVLNLL
jgi:NADPH:quinone reductase-like Zn-dependent oxidoreductase